MPTIAFLANLSTAEHKRRWDPLNKHAGDGVNVVVADPIDSPGELIGSVERRQCSGPVARVDSANTNPVGENVPMALLGGVAAVNW